MSPKSWPTELWVFLTCVAFAIFVFVIRRQAPQPRALAPRSALAAFPTGASLVVGVDLIKLRKSPLSGLVDEGSKEIIGSRVREICGFDPIDHARAVVLTIPNRTEGAQSDERSPPFGIAVTGDFSSAPITKCAVRVIEDRGGSPARTDLGSFVAIRDRRSKGEVAVRNGGPLLLSEGWYLREMIDASDDKVAPLTTDDQHATLRDSVGGKGGAIIATWISPPGWLEHLAGAEVARLSPLASVRAGALRINVSPRFEAKLVLGCPDRESCDDIAELVERMRTDLKENLVHELGEDPVIQFRASQESHSVRVFIELDPKKTAKIAARLLFSDAPPQNPEPEEPAPDEVVRPSPSSSASSR